MTNTSLLKFPKILILLLLVSFPSFLGVFLTPAFPSISQAYQIPPSKTAWVMSIFLIGYALGQLPFGPLSNRFGRKKALSIGMVITLCGSVLAYLSPSFSTLCLARFIQAIGAAGGLKMGFAIVGDIGDRKVAAQGAATLSVAFGVIPGISMTLGGWVTESFGWQNCFLFLILYTLGLWFFCQMLPETAPSLQKDALKFEKIKANYRRYFLSPQVMWHGVLTGLATLTIYMFSTFGPFIGINHIGLNSDTYGMWAFLPYIGFLIGAFLARKIGGENSPRVNMLAGIIVVIVSSAILALFFVNQLINVASFFLPTLCIYFGCNFLWSQSIAEGMSDAKDKSNASAVLQFMNLSITTVGIFLAQAIPIAPVFLYPLALGALSFFLLIVWLKLKPYHKLS